MFRYFVIVCIVLFHASPTLAQDSLARYTYGDSVLNDSVQRLQNKIYLNDGVQKEKIFTVNEIRKNDTGSYRYIYYRYNDRYETLEIVTEIEKEQYTEEYFIADGNLLRSKMRMINPDTSADAEKSWISGFSFIEDKPVYGWSLGTEINETMGKQVVLLYNKRVAELRKRL